MKIICIDMELGADHFNIFFMILKKKIRKKLNNYTKFTKEYLQNIQLFTGFLFLWEFDLQNNSVLNSFIYLLTISLTAVWLLILRNHHYLITHIII